MSRIADQMTYQELEALLYEINYHGYVVVPLRKLYRLLRKGNRAAGTWRALLDAWEGIENEREELFIAELPNEMLLISNAQTEAVVKWAEEAN